MALIAGPVLRDPAARLLGDTLGPGWRTLWAHDWTRRALAAGELPLSTDAIAFPAGGRLVSPSLASDLLSVPLQPLIGVVAAHNLLQLLLVPLAGLGAAVVGRQAGLTGAGGALAGTVYGFCALLLTEGLASGEPSASGIAVLPWALAACVALLRGPGLRTALAAGAAIAALGYTSVQWLLVASLTLPLPLAAELLRPAHAERRPSLPRLLASVAGATALALVLFGVPAATLLAGHGSGDLASSAHLTSRLALPGPEDVGASMHTHATLASYFYPGSRWLSVYEGLDRVVRSTYAGSVALLLASFGARRGTTRWLVLGVVAATLSLGPYLTVADDSWRASPVPWWLALWDLAPWIRSLDEPVRFAAPAQLALAVLAGAGADTWLREATSRARRAAAALVLSAAVFAEITLLSPVPVPLPFAPVEVPPVVAALADVGPGAVIDWPLRPAGHLAEDKRPFLWQMHHGRPIPWDFAAAAAGSGTIEDNPFLADLERATYGHAWVSPAWTAVSGLPVRRGLAELGAMGIRWLVFHPADVAPEQRAEATEYLDAWAIPVVRLPDGDTIYALDRAGLATR